MGLQIIAEEQADFRAGRSTTEQMFTLRLLCEKKKPYPVQARPLPCFIDFKKAFDRVWHAVLWATMKKYNIRGIKHLYDKATSAVLFSGSIGDWLWTTVGVRQGCLLPKRIITDALEDHEGTVSIGGRTITNLCLADKVDGSA